MDPKDTQEHIVDHTGDGPLEEKVSQLPSTHLDEVRALLAEEFGGETE